MTHIFADIWVPGKPYPGGSKRAVANRKTGKAILIDAGGENTNEWRAAVRHFTFNGYHGNPLDEALRVIFQFVYAHNKSAYGTGKNKGVLKATAPYFKTTEPDCDKLIRPVQDACIGILWVDDSCIVQVYGSKIWAVKPGLRLKVMRAKLPPPDVDKS